VTKTLDEFAKSNTKDQKAPSGWEPSVTWNGKEGVLSTGPLDGEPDPAIWANLIADWGLDPSLTEIVDGSVQVRAWDANVGGGDIRRLKYYRASIRSRQSAADRLDVEALCNLVERRKPLNTVSGRSGGDTSLVVLLSDWQVGNGEGGGTPAFIERIASKLDNLVAFLKELKKLGRLPATIYLIGLGDLVEGCAEFYAMQTFSVDLDRRSQKKLVRRCLLMLIEGLIPFNIPLVLGAVPGNHGENRRGGRAFTSWTDNDDLSTVEEVAEVLAANPERYGLVSVPTGAIAEDLTLTLSVSGITCGWAHGHQMNRGTGAAAKIEAWWKGQALGNQPVASADILFTGHLHHFVCSEATGRTIMQAPALDGGSYWFTAQSGMSSPAGMLVVGVGTGYGPRGWGDLKIL
jgi:hypothetical protein